MNGQVVRLTTHSLDQADMWVFGSFANNRGPGEGDSYLFYPGEPIPAPKSHFLMRTSCPLWGRSTGGRRPRQKEVP